MTPCPGREEPAEAGAGEGMASGSSRVRADPQEVAVLLELILH